MNFWSVLGMTPTNDIKAIKKSYAKLLKQFHPEDDPQGFQRLKEAYDSALNYAKYSLEDEEEDSYFIPEVNFSTPTEALPIEEVVFQDENEAENRNFINFEFDLDEYKGHNAESYGMPNAEMQVDDFINKVNELYDDFERRINLENWRTLFKSNIIWDMKAHDLLNFRMIHFLEEHHFLPLKVWKYLETAFDWHKNEEQLRLYHAREIVDYIFKVVKLDDYLDYSNLAGLEKSKLEAYLAFRDSAYWKSESGDAYYADRDLINARAIFSEDPELFYIEAMAFINNGSHKTAKEIVSKALMEFPKNERFLYLSAKFRFEEGKWAEALKQLEILQSNNKGKQENSQVQLLIIKCLVRLNKYELARENLLKLDLTIINNKAIEVLKQEIYSNLRNIFRSRALLSPWNAAVRKEYAAIKEEYEIKRSTRAKGRRWTRVLEVLVYIVVILIGLALATTVGITGIAFLYLIIKGLSRLFRKKEA